MPHLKEPKEKEPLWKDWDYLAQKKGIRHTVYSTAFFQAYRSILKKK
jgi:hypothetical protein